MRELKLSDLIPVEDWIGIEEELNSRSGLNASVFDADGLRITDFKKWANRLCPAIKADKRGQSFICSVAHQNLAAEARKTRQPVVGECDVGLLKLVVPIFVQNQFLGVMGGCGLLADDGEVDTFVVEKTTDLRVEDIVGLSEDIGRLKEAGRSAAISFLEDQRNQIVAEHASNAA